MERYFLLIIIFIFPVVIFSQSRLSFEELITKFDDQYESAFYDEALKSAKEALEKAENEFGEKSLQYATALHRRGVIALMLGDLPKAKFSFDKALEVLKDISKDNSPLAAKILSGLSIYYDYSDDFYSAEKCLKKALDIYKSTSGKVSYDYIKTLENLGNFYWDFNQYPNANQTYKNLYELIMSLYANDKPKSNNSDYSIMVLNYATLLKEQYEYEKVISILKDALKLIEYTKGKKHPDYRFVNDELISANILNGLKDDIDSIVIQSISSWSEELGNEFEYQSEQDKMFTLEYMTQNADVFYTYGIHRKETNKYITGDIFNFRTLTKGVVLESTYGIRNMLMHSHDESAINMYDELKSLKQTISKAYTMSGNERTEKKINLDSLERAARTLEMYIGNSLKDVDHALSPHFVRWEEIKKNLKEGETAIDFINFVNLRKKFYDSSYNASDSIYCAFIITPDSEFPEMIRLTSSAELETIISGENEVYLNEPSATSELYNLIIFPLEKFLTGTKKLYVSPSGILNRVSFASLKNNQGEYLIDKFDIVYCGNLSEIISANSGQGSSDFKDAVLFGGIQYDLDSIEYVNSSMKTRGENFLSEESNYEITSGINSLIINRDSKSGGWKFLPGTMSETQLISDELKMNSVNVKFFSGSEATESAFKTLSGNNSPSLIHISTHGFFFPDPYANLNYTQKEEISKKNQTSQKGVFRKSMNPLIRSGLILAGANLLWRDGKRIEGTDDGILTAHEVSSMDLFNTGLVILSACETGLGDIKNNEGVIGLQRAFKIAGVKNIIMSLWKVPDKETAELMETFYKYLFKDRSTVRDAFTKAQKDLRIKYNDPYYWSAFILI